MRKSRFTETQIVAILKEQDAGTPTTELARKHGIHPNTLRTWCGKYGGMESSDIVRLKQLEDDNLRLRRIVTDLTLDIDALKNLIAKLLGPSQRKAAVRALQAGGRSERRACELIRCPRATVRYRVRRSDDAHIRERMNAIACERRRFGYRKIGILLRREGFVMNHKHVYRSPPLGHPSLRTQLIRKIPVAPLCMRKKISQMSHHRTRSFLRKSVMPH